LKYLLLIACFILSMGAAWDIDHTKPQGLKWDTVGAPKWTQERSQYEEAGEGNPIRGYFRKHSELTGTTDWPSWVQDRFKRLGTTGLNDDDKRSMRWSKPPLHADTFWSDAKADPIEGAITLNVPSFAFFTYFTLEPEGGTIDQNFAGVAKVYDLRDDTQYRIHAFDANGYIGHMVTDIADTYIRAFYQTPDLYAGGRIPAMAQKVVEDRNENLWMSTYSVKGVTGGYRFIDIYSIDANGKNRASFQIPLITSYIRPWLSDLILEENGDVTFAAGEDPMGLSSYLGPSYIARLEKNGTTVWETPFDEIESAICIAYLGDGGYVYGGARFSADPAYIDDKQVGMLVRLNSTGGHSPWGVSGTSTISTEYSIRDIKRSNESYPYAAGTIDLNALPQEYGGSCSMTFDPAQGACGGAFDTGVGATIGGSPLDGFSDCTVTWDLGVGIEKEIGRVLIEAGASGGDHTLYVEGSDNGADWTEITNWHMGETAGLTVEHDVYVTSDAYRYFRLRFDDNGAGTMNTFVDTFWPYGATSSGTSGVANYHYVAGRANTGGARLFAPIQTEGTPSSAYSINAAATDQECAQAMDGDLVGVGFGGEGNCMDNPVGCGWNRGANQTAVKSKVWYRTLVASTITLQYNDGAWQTISSIAATADGAQHLWEVNFAAVTATHWRLTFSTAGGAPCAPYLYEWQLYPDSTGGGILAKYVLSGVTGGTELWQTKLQNAESMAGIFNAAVISPRDETRIYGFGSTENSTVNLSLNKGLALCVNQSGVSQWYKEFSEVSEFYDAAPTEDGGFLLAGTLYSGTSVQARSAVIMKIDKAGNVDPKFPQTFAEDGSWADGRGIIETRDKGVLMVGGSSRPSANTSAPYFVKLNRFMKAKSKGNTYD